MAAQVTGRVHSVESFGTVDGPGVRFVVFLQGCPMRCLYCHNPDTWDPGGGVPTTVEELLAQYARNEAFYRKGGITVTGGEPLLQIEFVTALFRESGGASTPVWIPRAPRSARRTRRRWRSSTRCAPLRTWCCWTSSKPTRPPTGG